MSDSPQRWWVEFRAVGVPLIRRRFPVILMCLGLGLLLYVGAQYAHMYIEQRSLARQWSEQQRKAAAQPQDGLTRLSIPKIDFNAIVVEGTGRRDLLLGPGHMESTAQPGDTGNAVITGHRDTFFRHIYELDRGDVITVQRSGQTYNYEVTGKKIVDPQDLSVIKPSGERQLTLITCYPTYYVGPAPERLVIFSKLQGELPANAAVALDAPKGATALAQTSASAKAGK
jgi:LPXTG-site transpeptidase (sortase) family protein